VKDSFRSRGSASTGAVDPPASEVGRTDSARSGTPASSKSSANNKAVSGVSEAGLRMTGQPAARAGAILRVAIASGKFQGVMNRHGPTGRDATRSRPEPDGAGR